MEFWRNYKRPIVLAFLQWLITVTLQTDRLFFTYNDETVYLFLTKGLYFVFLNVSWCFAFKVYREVKSNNASWKRGCYIFFLYLFVSSCFLLVLWPGTWAFDDLWGLVVNCTYESLNPWQHILTGAYQNVLLQILPFPGGIIFLQSIIISLCVAFIIVTLEQVFRLSIICSNRLVDTIIKLLPFLLPPVLMFQFSGYRMGLYVYLEAVMLVSIVSMFKKRNRFSWRSVWFLSLLSIIVSAWRTESFVYIPLVCISLAMVNKNVVAVRKKVVCIFVILIGFVGITKIQNWGVRVYCGNSSYEVMSLMRPCAELVRRADPTKDARELAAIDKVADVNLIMNNPESNGEMLYWNTDCIRIRNSNPDDDYTTEDYRNFLRAIVSLSLKYPSTIFNERLSVLIDASGINGNSVIAVSKNSDFAANLFDSDNNQEVVKIINDKHWYANRPPFKETRKRLINTIGITGKEGSFIAAIKRIIWNVIIPALILIYAWIKSCIKKEWYSFGILTAVLSKFAFVILTEPSTWFMYFLSFYLLGYIILLFGTLRHVRKHF